MEDFFNRQEAAIFIREWKSDNRVGEGVQYSKFQVDQLQEFLKERLFPLFNYYLSQNSGPFRAELPMLYIGGGKMRFFNVEILVIGSTIECINVPGCMSFGSDILEAFNKLLYALIECSDARFINGMGFMNIVYTMKPYYPSIDISSNELKAVLKEDGWDFEYKGYYNSVLLRKGNKVTFTIPQNCEKIDTSMYFNFKRLQMQVSSDFARDQDTYLPE